MLLRILYKKAFIFKKDTLFIIKYKKINTYWPFFFIKKKVDNGT